MLAHLADAGALKRFLQALPAPSDDAAWSEAQARAQWAGACLANEFTAAALPDAPRGRALQNVALAPANSGRVAEASARLTREAPAAMAHADAPACRACAACAACANNVALELREGRQGAHKLPIAASITRPTSTQRARRSARRARKKKAG